MKVKLLVASNEGLTIMERNINFNSHGQNWIDDNGMKYDCIDITHMIFEDGFKAKWQQIKREERHAGD